LHKNGSHDNRQNNYQQNKPIRLIRQIDFTKSKSNNRLCNMTWPFISPKGIFLFTTRDTPRDIGRAGLPIADTVVMIIAEAVVTEPIWFWICTCAHARLELSTAGDRAATPR